MPESKHLEDVILWPDDTWCYRYVLHEMSWKSDDYQVLYFGTKDYENFFERKLNE